MDVLMWSMWTTHIPVQRSFCFWCLWLQSGSPGSLVASEAYSPLYHSSFSRLLQGSGSHILQTLILTFKFESFRVFSRRLSLTTLFEVHHTCYAAYSSYCLFFSIALSTVYSWMCFDHLSVVGLSSPLPVESGVLCRQRFLSLVHGSFLST